MCFWHDMLVFYVTLVAVALSSKRSYVLHPLSGIAVSSVHSQLICAVIVVIKEGRAFTLHI